MLRGPVLVATDLSEAADAALREGHALALSLGGPPTVCHVLPEAFRARVLFPHEAGIDTPTQDEFDRRARTALAERLAGVLGSPAADLPLAVESGSAHAGILRAAARLNAGVIVLGPGRTAHRVARSFGGPVLVVRASPDGGAVLGATDFSDPALPAVHAAIDEAARRKAALRLVHCLDIEPTAYLAPAGVPGLMPITPLPPALFDELEHDARARLQGVVADTGAAAETIVLRRPPSMGIVEAARDTATSLVVVGTRGRTGLSRLALGSVAEEVMNDAPCSVLVVPLNPAG